MLDALTSLCAGDPERAASVLEVPKTQLELVALNAALCVPPRPPAPTPSTPACCTTPSGWPRWTAPPGAGRPRRVRVTSSLFGLVAPTDRIPAYRLSGDAVLPGLGSVAGVWREALGPVVTELVGDGLLVDLRSGMYAAFWRPTGLRRVATVRVLHEVAGKRQVVSHFNKATKGRIVRALLESGANPRTPARLAEALRDLGWTVEVDRRRQGRGPARRGRQRPLTVAPTRLLVTSKRVS